MIRVYKTEIPDITTKTGNHFGKIVQSFRGKSYSI